LEESQSPDLGSDWGIVFPFQPDLFGIPAASLPEMQGVIEQRGVAAAEVPSLRHVGEENQA
jgi:hypothetical protein